MIKLFISAIEPSGDILGAELMRSLKELNPAVEFYGLGGPLMAQEGLTSLFPIDDLAIMGFMEVLPKLSEIIKRLHQTVDFINHLQPDGVITIDGLGFHKRLIKKIQHLRTRSPFIQYVAPAVWAWKPGRAKKIAPLFDKLLVIFPFEPPYFEHHGLSTVFIGHPVTKRLTGTNQNHKNEKHQIVLLPGSRHQEIKRHLPVFLQAGQMLAKELSCRFILPTVKSMVPLVKEYVRTSPLPVEIICDEKEKYHTFQTSDFAIAASGSVTLELAMARLPAVIAYKTSKISYEIAKRLARVRFICMVNILLDEGLVPELIQDQCNPRSIVQTVLTILTSPEKLDHFHHGYEAAIHKLSAPFHKNPSHYAADIIYNCLKIKPLSNMK